MGRGAGGGCRLRGGGWGVVGGWIGGRGRGLGGRGNLCRRCRRGRGRLGCWGGGLVEGLFFFFFVVEKDGGGCLYGYLSRASWIICRERRVCDCAARRRSVWTSSARKAVIFSCREMHMARKGWCSPLVREGAGTAGSSAEVLGSAKGMSAYGGFLRFLHAI